MQRHTQKNTPEQQGVIVSGKQKGTKGFETQIEREIKVHTEERDAKEDEGKVPAGGACAVVILPLRPAAHLLRGVGPVRGGRRGDGAPCG